MADLLAQFEPALQSLKALGARADEVDGQLVKVHSRVESDRATFESKSKNLVPRAQALVAKLAGTQADLQSSFELLTQQITDFRANAQSLEANCRKERQSLVETVKQLQSQHDALQAAAEDLHGRTNGVVFNHGVEAQNSLQQIAPHLEDLDGLMRNTVIPVSAALGDEVVRKVGDLGKNVHQTVVPTLHERSTHLGNQLHLGADAMRAKALQLARDMEKHTEDLMRQALAAAQKVNARSDSRILELVGEVQLDVDEAMKLIRNIQGARRGLHSANRLAMGALATIIRIIDDLSRLVHKLEQGGSN